MATGATRASGEAAAHLDRAWLRDLVETLASIHRPTASQGERVAAEWLVARLGELGARDARVEHEPVHGTFWWPLGLAAVAGVAAGMAALRGRRLAGATIATVAGAAAADDLPPGRRTLRSLLPRRTATNVVAELGPPDAERTVVLVAHHDAAHAGLVYHPAIPELVFGRFPWLLERVDTSPPLMAPVVGVPLLVGAGALTGSRALVKAGTALAALSAAALAEMA